MGFPIDFPFEDFSYEPPDGVIEDEGVFPYFGEYP